MEKQFESFEKKRFLYYVLTVVVGFMYGLGYTWSVVQTPFVEAMNGDPAKITATVALVYTACVLFSTMSPTLFGGFTKKLKPNQLTIIGGAMFGIGYLACGHIHTLPLLFFTYSVLTGIGTGLVYPTLMGYVATLYPEKTGTYSSIYAGVYGGSAMVWSPLLALIVANNGLEGMSNIIGPVSFVIIVVIGFIIKPAPEGYIDYKKSQMAAPAASGKKAPVSKVPDLNRGQMAKTPIFYIAMVTFAFGLTSGMFVISQASPILQSQYGLTAVGAATFVSLNSFASLAGRIVFGTVTDHTDKYVTLCIIPALSVVGMGLLSILMKNPTSHIAAAACMAIVAFGYGGFGGTITPITADLFGTKYITENFGVMYLNFGIAALIGPRIAVKFGAGSGNYPLAFGIGAVIALISVIAAFVVRAKVKASQKA